MKLTKIHIKNHYQFKDLDLDLTYPEGHDKAGQALDKVCFIGQSGTGKTTLLEEIWNTLTTQEQKASIPQQVRDISFVISYQTGWDKDQKYLVELKKEGIKAPLEETHFNIIEKPPPPDVSYRIHYNIRAYNPMSDLKTRPKMYFHLALKNQSILNECQYTFPLSIEQNGWEKVKGAIQLHQKEKIKYDLAISDAFKANNLDLATEYAQKLAEWEANNDTPLLDLANNYLNKILKNFNLTVKTALESWEEVNSIHLMNPETLETIPLEHWSSGIKNIIARTIPLYTHKFKNALICIDEPETSLYPDIQRKIIDIYTEIAPDNQFFFATHSPVIASSFEPWEIVELKFNKEGYVYRDQYWEGENHVDNYKYDPRYLRWDSILQNIFDLENDGSDERKGLLQKFANLDNKLKKRKKKGEKLSKEDPEVQDLIKMGKQLGWDTKQEKV
jgi:predicted ATP-dependent endonuclease of OLD family